MSTTTSASISRYTMRAFGRNTKDSRVPGQRSRGAKVVSTARIVLSIQFDGAFRFLSFNPVDVRGDLSEWYGYSDDIPSDEAPSMIDVITQAHEIMLGNEFTRGSCREYFDIDEDGIVQRILGLPGRFTCFALNGRYVYDANSEYGKWGFRGLTYQEAVVSDWDVVELFGFQESVGLDYYTYFLKPDGDWLRSAIVAPGEPITLQHEGYLFVIGGPYRHVDRIEQRMVAPIEGSKLAIVDPLTYEFVDIENAVTDKKGFVTFSLDKPGDYYITAYDGKPPRNRASLSLPCIPVIVR